MSAKLKPDQFIPFHGDEFFTAVEGFEPIVSLGYLRAIWYYWSHTHCAGLKDDQNFLRRICRIEQSDWEEVMCVIFDNDQFFKLDNSGLWRQKRADELWKKAEHEYNRNRLAGLAGAKARWSHKKGGSHHVK